MLTYQLVFCGDFFQLPPVHKNEDVYYAFDTECWEKMFAPQNVVTLTRVYRQNSDVFIKTLESLRRGAISDEQEDVLLECNRTLLSPEGVEPVWLWVRQGNRSNPLQLSQAI